MTAMRKIQIELPEHLAEDIDRKVASGDYNDASDVIVHSLEGVAKDDPFVEHWLRTEVVPMIERMQREGTSGIPGDEVKRRIRARHQASTNLA